MKHLNFLSKSSSQSCGHSSVTLASTVGSPSAHRRSTMLRLLSVLVLILTFGVGQMWGVAFSFTSNVSGWPTAENSTAAGDKTYTVGSTSYTFNLGPKVYCNSSYLMLKYTTYLGLPAISGQKLTGVTIHNSSQCSTSSKVTITAASNNSTAISGGDLKTLSTQNHDYSWTLSGTSANTMYYLYITNKNCQITSITCTYEAVSSCTNPTTALSVSSSASATVGTPMTLTTANGNGGPVTWEITNGDDKATLDDATLTPTGEGSVTIKATQDDYTTGGKTYCGGNASKTITITKAPATITLSELGATSSVSGTHYGGDSYTLPTSTDATCTGKKLVGWSRVEIEETDIKPTSNFYAKGETVTLTAGTNTFYAVFAAGDGGTLTVTRSEVSTSGTGYAECTWTVGTINGKVNLYKNTTSYIQIGGSNLPHPYNSTELPAAISKITITMPNSGTCRTWTPRVSATAAQSTASSTSGTNLTGKTFSSTGTSLVWDVDTDEDYRYFYLSSGGNTNIASFEIEYGTYTKYATSCCTSLGQINGSIDMSQTSATLTWDDLEGVAASNPYAVTYRKGSEAYGSANVGDITTNAQGKKTCTITGLECGTEYDFKIAVTGDGSHCDAEQVLEDQSTTKWNINYNLTNTVALSEGPAQGANACGEISASFTKNALYTFPENITVTIGGVEASSSTDYDWDANEGELLIDAAKVTGNVVIAIEGVAPANPVVTPNPAALNFASVKKGAAVPAAQDIEITGQNLTTDLTVTSSDPALYAVSVKSGSLTPDGDKNASPVITVTPQEGITSTAGDKNATITISGGGLASNVVVNVTFNVQETYTVNWYVNGTKIDANSKTDVTGTAVTAPSDFTAFTDCSELHFIGWATSAISGGSSGSKPTLVTPITAIGTANVNYYAVFAEGTPASTETVLEESLSSGISTEGWTFNSKCYTASSTVRLSTGDDPGVMTSPALTSLEGDATLTFEIKGWGNTKDEEGQVGISASTGTFSTISFTTSSFDDFEEVSATLSGGDETTIITFTGTAGKRIYVKNVKVTQTIAEDFSMYYTTCPHYYTVTLTNDGIVDGKGSFVADKASALAGESVKLTATGTENAGRFNSWNITGLDSYSATTNPLTISMPDNDITVSATFDALYAINKELVHGTFTLDKNYAIEGATVTISNVAADAQYKNPVITVFKTGDESATISVTAGVFTMPAYPVTVRVVCEPAIEPLAAPVLGEATDATYQGVTLNWTGVAGNEGYVLTVQQGGVDVEGLVNVAIAQNATSYTIASGLAANTDYTYSIYTKGNGTTTMEVNTPANGNFSTEDYPNVTLYYSENGELSAGVSQKILTDFELADPASDPCTKKFVGWSTVTVAETDAEPAMMAPGATYQIPTNENCTIYAVYATASMTTNWLDTELDDLTASDEFVLGSSEYAIPNNASGTPAVEAITVSAGAVTSTVSDNLRWNVSGNATDGYSFSPNGSTTTWLYCNTTADSKSNDNIRVGSGDRKVWELDGDGYLVTKDTYVDRYLSIFVNNSSEAQDFRGYITTGNGAFEAKFYKKTSSISSYSGYATTCTGKVATPSFSGVTDGETYEEDKTVSLGCATGEATIRYTMSNDGTTPADPTGESTAATSISLNADGVYVIKAKAFKDGMDASDVATISVTINKPCTTIASFIAVRPSTAKKLVFTAESNAVVLGVNTNRIYIQDPTGGLLLYKTAHEKTWTKGKKVVGTVIGTYAEVDNAPRMLVTDFGETVATIDGEIPSAVVIEGAINANFAANRNKLVTVSDLHFQAQSVGGGNSINITRGDDTYQIYNAFNALNDHVLPLTETACSVTGILGYHSNKYQLMPIDANCITTGATAVLPEFVGETGGADAEHPTEVASGEVIKLTAAEGMTSNYTIGESAPVSITTNTEAVISGANNDLIAITISAEREYYTDNSVTYYYKINNALTKYIITSAVVENGTFKVKNSDASAEITSAVAGATVTLVAEPTHTETAQYSLDHWTVYETGNTSNTVSVENNQFIMPSFAVTVSATFAEDAYATVVFDGGDATGTAPAGGKKYVGQEVTMPNKGALVKANHVLASWTYNETEYAVGDTYEIQEGDAAIGGKNITFTANWTPYPWANGGDWMLVTNAAEVTAGSYVIIAAAASNVAMSTTQNNNNRAQQSISKNDNLLTYTTAPAIFEVRAGNIENTLAFYDVVNEGYIYAASSSKNYLRTETTLSDNSSWNVAILNTGVAEMQAQGTNNHDKLQYNSSSSIFSCYESFDQASVSLYKYYAPVPKVTYDKNTEDEVTNMPNPSVQRAENNKATIAAGPSRTGYTFEGWKNGNTTYTVGEEYTFTEDITLYAQWAALPSFHVTYNTSGSQGTTPTDATNYYEGDEVILASASGLSNAGYFFAGWNDGTSTYPAGGEYTMPGSNVTFTAVWSRESAQKWALVKQGDELEINGEYIIASTVDAKTYALGDITTMGSNKVGQPLDVNRNGDILKGSEAMVVYTLVAGNGDNTYAFKNGDNYITWSSGNTLDKKENIDNNSSWKITIGEGDVAAISNVGDENRKMQYNSSNPRFACYTSAQKDVQLFKKVALAEISTSVDASTLSDNTDVIIREGGVLNVNNDKTIGDLTVENGGKVTLSSNKLTVVGTFTIETTMASGKSGQLSGATESNFEAQEDAYIDITLGDNGNPEKWHAFTVPFPVDAINGIYDLDGNKLTNEVNYAIMDYHGDIRATGDYGWKKYRGVLVPGTFYLMTVDGERTTYRFKKTANGAIVAGNTKQLHKYASSTGRNDNGWNGVGNPTLMYGTVDQNVQVLNPVSYTYEPYTAGNQNFVVGTPFFVQAASDGTMTMSAADGSKQYYAPARQAAKEIKDVKVTFGNEEYTDKLYISASEEALNEYQIGKDLVKMTMTSTPKVAQIFGKAYNAKLCMVYAPMANDQAVYDLTLYAPKAGEYTIAAPNVENTDLYLTYEGSIIWDLSMSAYPMELKKGNNEGYGLLLQAKMPMTPTGIEDVQGDNVQCTKVVIDEHVYILRGGEMYDVTGKAVK